MTSSSTSLSLFHLDQGNTYLINHQYQSAITSYTTCIELTAATTATNTENDTNDDHKQRKFITFRAYSHRAESHLRLKDYTNAKVDIQQCHSQSSSLQDFDSMEVGLSFVRLGKACYELKEYDASLKSLEEALVLCGENHSLYGEINDYKSKCEEYVSNVPSTVGEIKTKTETKEAPAATAAAEPTKTATKKKPLTCPKYQYYQDDNYMTIAILEPNLDETKMKVEFSLDKLTVIVQKGGKEFTVICGTLFSATIVSKSKVKYRSEKVLIKLKKKHKHEWNTLFGAGAQDDDKEEVAEGGDATTATNTATTAAIPTIDTTEVPNRPYASHRDWNAIERNLKKEEEAEKPAEGEAFNKFLKSMYAGADEETKRAMIKSYQTSGGTHLSGNWDEVSKTDYEKIRTAPKGQEWKNWEGQKLPSKDA